MTPKTAPRRAEPSERKSARPIDCETPWLLDLLASALVNILPQRGKRQSPARACLNPVLFPSHWDLSLQGPRINANRQEKPAVHDSGISSSIRVNSRPFAVKNLQKLLPSIRVVRCDSRASPFLCFSCFSWTPLRLRRSRRLGSPCLSFDINLH